MRNLALTLSLLHPACAAHQAPLPTGEVVVTQDELNETHAAIIDFTSQLAACVSQLDQTEYSVGFHMPLTRAWSPPVSRVKLIGANRVSELKIYYVSDVDRQWEPIHAGTNVDLVNITSHTLSREQRERLKSEYSTIMPDEVLAVPDGRFSNEITDDEKRVSDLLDYSLGLYSDDTVTLWIEPSTGDFSIDDRRYTNMSYTQPGLDTEQGYQDLKVAQSLIPLGTCRSALGHNEIPTSELEEARQVKGEEKLAELTNNLIEFIRENGKSYQYTSPEGHLYDAYKVGIYSYGEFSIYYDNETGEFHSFSVQSHPGNVDVDLGDLNSIPFLEKAWDGLSMH